MDVNDNGFLSLAEVTRGVRDVLALQEIFNCRPAVNAAFHHCRDIHKVKSHNLRSHLMDKYINLRAAMTLRTTTFLSENSEYF